MKTKIGSNTHLTLLIDKINCNLSNETKLTHTRTCSVILYANPNYAHMNVVCKRFYKIKFWALK